MLFFVRGIYDIFYFLQMARVPPLFISDQSELEEFQAELPDDKFKKESEVNFKWTNPLLRYKIEKRLGRIAYLVKDLQDSEQL